MGMLKIRKFDQYRIWDRVEERWLNAKDKMYIQLNGTLKKGGVFSFLKSNKLNEQRYIIHSFVRFDNDGQAIYEGDLVEFKKENETYLCIVFYSEEMASYLLIECGSKEHYFFTFTPTSKIKKIGNIIENGQLIKNKELFDAAKTQRFFNKGDKL